MSSLFDIGRSGLQSYRRALSVTGQNIANVNTDSDSMNAAKLGVRGIPALFLFHNGKMVANQTGMVPKPALTNWLNQQMSASDF